MKPLIAMPDTPTMNDLICVSSVEGEPRVLDTDLAAALGMSVPSMIRTNVIWPNRTELEGFGIILSRKINTRERGRPATAFLRWSPFPGQFRGWDKLGSGPCHAVNLIRSDVPW